MADCAPGLCDPLRAQFTKIQGSVHKIDSTRAISLCVANDFLRMHMQAKTGVKERAYGRAEGLASET